MITIVMNIEKIAENDRKIEQLTKNIKRDTEKRKKLMEENSRLRYNALLEQFNCEERELLDIIRQEHDQAEMLKASGVSENDLYDLCDKKSTAHGSASVHEDQMTFYDHEDSDDEDND